MKKKKRGKKVVRDEEKEIKGGWVRKRWREI